MDKIIIIGGEGTALNIADAITDSIENYNYPYELLGFANDFIEKKTIGIYPIITSIKDISRFYTFNDVKFLFALYKPELLVERTKLFEKISIPSDSQINFIHPSSYLSKNTKIGNGNAILQNCTIQNSCIIGNNNIISSNCVIEHNSLIDNNNFIAAGSVIGANVKISNCCFIGLNSTIRENVTLQSNTFLGMGSLLLKNTSENEKWYGSPAKRI